jgi:tRNA U34 5-carboxymethylaminomethyl modifying GTPase MnmE/TrmE
VDASGDRRSARICWLTPIGDAAVAVLRIEGPGAAALLERHLRQVDRPSRRVLPTEHGLVVRTFVDADGAPVDEVLLRQVGGAAFELCGHGGFATCQRMAAALCGAGAVLEATPPTSASGLEQEVHRALLAAPSALAVRFFLDELRSGVAVTLRKWLAAAELDAERVTAALALWRSRYRSAHALLVPPRVVIVGAVNAGKSSLLNALAHEERAMVSPTAGTTRDPLRSEILVDGYAVQIWDTAGFARDASHLDHSAFELSRSLADEADLVIELVELTCERTRVDPWPVRAARLTVGSKSDLAPRSSDGAGLDLLCSAATGAGLAQLRQAIRQGLGLLPAQELSAPAPFLPRHLGLLERALGVTDASERGYLLREWLQEAASRSF